MNGGGGALLHKVTGGLGDGERLYSVQLAQPLDVIRRQVHALFVVCKCVVIRRKCAFAGGEALGGELGGTQSACEVSGHHAVKDEGLQAVHVPLDHGDEHGLAGAVVEGGGDLGGKHFTDGCGGGDADALK